ncbi:cornifin-A-like [Columba livia]|uniref:cornifin-A-like n=1 Tax=Columba livia TaxID=8932 RepID=UPI0031BBB11A
MLHCQGSFAAYKSFQPQRCPRDSDFCSSHPTPVTGAWTSLHRMQHSKGDSGQDSCGSGSVCSEKGWTWHDCPSSCHKSPMSSPCHNPGSLSHDSEGSCQPVPQGCQPVPQGCQPTKPCPPQSCCPSQQNKPRRRVEVSHVQPVCPPPMKIRRRPLQQYRPPHSEEPGCCDKPCRRVEQETCPPMAPHPPPLQHCRPCIPCCRPPVRCRCRPPAQHRCPAPRPLPLHPSQQQQKQVPLLPPCLQVK